MPNLVAEEIIISGFDSLRQQIVEIQKTPERLGVTLLAYAAAILGLIYSKALPWSSIAALVVISDIFIGFWFIISFKALEKVDELGKVQEDFCRFAKKISDDEAYEAAKNSKNAKITEIYETSRVKKNLIEKINNKSNYFYINKQNLSLIMVFLFLAVNSYFIIILYNYYIPWHLGFN